LLSTATVVMPRNKKNTRSSNDKRYQAHNRAQSLEVARVMKALEDISLSGCSLMSGNSREHHEIGMASIPESPQSFSFSAIGIMALSSSKSDESATNQEEGQVLSTSQAEPDPRNVPIDAIDEKVAMLVNFMLLKYKVKEPITKEEMLTTVIKGCGNHFAELLLRASERMEMVFGLDVQEVDPINHQYVVLIKLGLTYDGMMSGEEGVPKTGILILVLGVIFMKGNRATEEEIWEVLSFTGVYPGVKHFIFGEPRQLITKDFVKENYLIYQQVASSHSVVFEFLWGPRACAETTKMKVLEFLAKVHGTDPSSFPSQYEEALKDDAKRVQGNVSARAESSIASAKFRSSSHINTQGLEVAQASRYQEETSTFSNPLIPANSKESPEAGMANILAFHHYFDFSSASNQMRVQMPKRRRSIQMPHRLNLTPRLGAHQPHYGLLIKLGLTYDGVLSGGKGQPRTSILILVLGTIFMKGNQATEEVVQAFLSLMNIYLRVKHFIFGEPIIRNFVKEKYLVYQQVENSDPAQFEFLWGPHAHAETTKKKVLQFLARVNKTYPSSFASHCEGTLQNEEMKAGADSPYFLLLEYKMKESIMKAHVLENVSKKYKDHIPERRRASEGIMPRHHKNPRCSEKLRVHISKARCPEVAQISKALQETSISSRPVVPTTTKIPDADIASLLEEPESFNFSAFTPLSTLTSKAEEGSTSQEKDDTPSTSQVEPATRKVPIDALEEKVAMLVNFMLLKYQTKESITKEDILNTVIKEDENHFTEILLRASERMEMIFGLDVQEVDATNHRYVLLIKLGLTYDGMMSDEEGVPKTGILILILGVIFMKGNRATEEEVWEVLNLTGIYAGVRHFVFGEPRQLITEDFVKENYLVYQQVEDSDPPQFEFMWGPRAHAETTKLKVLEFLAKVHGTDPSSFPAQYEEALQDEKERAEGNVSAKDDKAYDLEVDQVTKTLEETSLSFHPLIPVNSKEAPEAPLARFPEALLLLSEVPPQENQMTYAGGEEDMLEIPIQEYEAHFMKILMRATECMDMIFGLNVKEVDPISHYCDLFHPDSCLVVSFMKSPHATEEAWEVLNFMNIYPGVRAFIFGEPRKLITQDFLVYPQVESSALNQFELLWGSRAHTKITKMKNHQFLAKVNKTDPSCFPYHKLRNSFFMHFFEETVYVQTVYVISVDGRNIAYMPLHSYCPYRTHCSLLSHH
ncbi:Melanoma-associated antigen B16, partial [Galemys pyrenaicus]